MLEWEEGFFNSQFTHPSGIEKLTSHAGGFIDLWTELAGKQQFPANYLGAVQANNLNNPFLGGER
jgi:hypothetical protein